MKIGDTIMVPATVMEFREDGPFPIELDIHGNHVVLNTRQAKHYISKEREANK